jgi:hypothetical protein
VIGSAAPCWLTAWVAARRWQVTARAVASPWGLVIGGLGVLVSRLISFVPGLLAGKTIMFAVDDGPMRERVRVFRLRIVLTLGAGAAAWIVASAIPGRGGWFTLWGKDTAVATAVVALTGMAHVAAIPAGASARRTLSPLASEWGRGCQYKLGRWATPGRTGAVSRFRR